MKRSTKRFLAMAEQLDKEIDKSVDLFFEKRPFLTRNGEGFKEQTDEDIIKKVDNQIAIDELVKEIKKL